MAQNLLGEIYWKIRADSSDFHKGVNNAKKAHQGLWQQITKGITVFAIYQKAVQLVSKFFGDSVKQISEAEKVHAILVQTLKNSGGALGLTAQQIEATSKAYQKMSIFGDEAITMAQTQLIQFTHIGKDIFPQATKAIVDAGSKLGDLGSAAQIVGRALERPSLGMRQLRSLNIIFTEAQQKTITKMEEMGNIAGAQKIILDRLNQTYGGMAATMRDTLGGSVEALKNSFGDMQENIGLFISAIGKPLINFLNDVVTKINEFLESDEGFETIVKIVSNLTAVFSVLWEIGKFLVEQVFKVIGRAIEPIVEAFKKLFPEGQKATIVFEILTGVMKVLAVVFTIVGNVIALVLQNVIDLVMIVEKSANTFRRFAEAMTDPFNPKRWEELKKAGGEVINAFGNLLKNFAINLYKLGKDANAGIVDLILNTKKDAKKLEEVYTNTAITLEEAMRKAREGMEKGLSEDGGGTEPPGAKIIENFKTRWQEAFDKLKDGFKASLTIMQEEMDKWQNLNSNIMGQISSIIDQASSNAIAAAENEYNARKAYIEANVSDETDRTTQLEALDAEYAEKKKQLQKEAWIANKAIAVINAIINTALAVTNALATPPAPVGIALAVIMGALGAIQTGLILAQPMPAFAEGGIAYATPGGQTVRVAEAGANEYMIPDKASVWNQIASRLAENLGNTNNYNTVNNNLPGNLTLQVGENQMAAALSDMSRRGKFLIDPKRGISKR